MSIESLTSMLRINESRFSPRLQYRINLLRILVYANLLAACILLIFSLTGELRHIIGGFIFTTPVFLFNVYALRKLSQGVIEGVARILVFSAWITFAIAAFGSGGLYSSMMMVMMSLLVTGILVLDMKARVVLLALTISYYFFLLYVEVSGNLPDAPFKDLPFRMVILNSVALSSFLIVNYHLYAFRKSEEENGELRVSTERFKVQSRLTQDIAHDLRTPLATMKTSSYIVRKRIAQDLPVDEALERMDHQIERINGMIENLFQLTLLDEQDEFDTFVVMDLKDIITACIANSQVYASERSMSIQFDHDSSGGYLFNGSIQRIGRMFDNLIENAIHYGKEKGQIDIRLSTEKNYHILQVKDDGIGIAPEHREKIFERFYRVNDARTGGQHIGTGIGLNSVLRTVQYYGGSVQVDSEPDQGSTFTIRLPVHKQKQETSATKFPVRAVVSSSDMKEITT